MHPYLEENDINKILRVIKNNIWFSQIIK
jgi:hypothetical protein